VRPGCNLPHGCYPSPSWVLALVAMPLSFAGVPFCGLATYISEATGQPVPHFLNLPNPHRTRRHIVPQRGTPYPVRDEISGQTKTAIRGARNRYGIMGVP